MKAPFGLFRDELMQFRKMGSSLTPQSPRKTIFAAFYSRHREQEDI